MCYVLCGLCCCVLSEQEAEQCANYGSCLCLLRELLPLFMCGGCQILNALFKRWCYVTFVLWIVIHIKILPHFEAVHFGCFGLWVWFEHGVEHEGLFHCSCFFSF